MSILERLDELIRQGEELVPKGGTDLKAGYNRELQPEYDSWRTQCIDVIKELGEISPQMLHELQSDTRGSHFYQNSASRVLGAIKLVRSITRQKENRRD